MHQNLEVLDVLMFIATFAVFSPNIVSVGEKVYVFIEFCCSHYKKPKKLEWALNWIFQNIWVVKLLWAEVVIGLNGKLLMVKCIIYIDVEKCEKFIVPKFDGLHKHASCWKVFEVKLRVTKGQCFVSSTNQHAKSKW